MSAGLSNFGRSSIVGSFGVSDITLEVLSAPALGRFLRDGGSVELTIWDESAEADPSLATDREIVRATGVSGNIIDVERGRGRTTARSHSAGDAVIIAATAFNIRSVNGLNVLDWDADPTDGDQSTTAMQEAIDATPTTGGTVFIPPGTYRLSQGLKVYDRDHLRISAYGAKLRYHDDVAEVGNGYGVYFLRSNHCYCEGLEVDGNRQNRSTSVSVIANHQFMIDGCTHITLKDCISGNATADGFYAGGIQETESTDCSFIDCEAYGARRNGLSITDGKRIRITRGSYHNTSNDLNENPGAGIDLEPNPAGGLRDVVITGVSFYGNESYGLLMTGGKNTSDPKHLQDVVVSDCVFLDGDSGNYYSDIRVLYGSGIRITDCQASGGSHVNVASISLQNAFDSSVNGCRVSKMRHTGNAIWVASTCSGVQVTGNSIEDHCPGSSTSEAIQVDCDEAIVTGNQVDGCGSWGINATLSNKSIISGNLIKECNLRGIVIGGDGVTLINNMIIDMQDTSPRAISIGEDSRKCIVTGNVCWQSSATTGTAIVALSELNGVIGPNQVNNWSQEVDVDGTAFLSTEIYGATRGSNDFQEYRIPLVGNNDFWITLEFDQDFLEPPHVQVTGLRGDGANGIISTACRNVTVSQCEVSANRHDGANSFLNVLVYGEL